MTDEKLYGDIRPPDPRWEQQKEYMSNEEADKMLQESMREIFDDLDYEARLLELQLEHSAWRAKATTIGVVFGVGMYCLGLWMGQL